MHAVLDVYGNKLPESGKYWTISLPEKPAPAAAEVSLMHCCCGCPFLLPPVLAGLLVNAAMLRLSSLCVEANSSAMVSGTQMILSSCSGNYRQLFRAGSGVNSTRIETVFKTTSGVSLCLGVSSSGTAQGSRVTLQTCGTGASQRWAVDGSGRFLPSHVAGMCLDTEAGSTAAGALLVINACSNVPTQLVVVAAAGELGQAWAA
jgi:hypothetical protein